MLYPDIRLILEHRATAFALFVKSQRKWTSPPTKPESISSFKDRLKEFGYSVDHILPHGSYLMNMGNPDRSVGSPRYYTYKDKCDECAERNARSLTSASLMNSSDVKSSD